MLRSDRESGAMRSDRERGARLSWFRVSRDNGLMDRSTLSSGCRDCDGFIPILQLISLLLLAALLAAFLVKGQETSSLGLFPLTSHPWGGDTEAVTEVLHTFQELVMGLLTTPIW